MKGAPSGPGGNERRRCMKNRIICAAILAVFLLSTTFGCATSGKVTFDSNVKGAKVSLNGKEVGKTPFTTRMSYAVWENPDIVVKADGYKTVVTKAEKEGKIGAIILGYFLGMLPALLWSYGPSSYQYFNLYPENE
jgi:hypothetical protein